MDASLSKALAKRFVTEVNESEAVIRHAIAQRIIQYAPTKKGARKAISAIVASFHSSMIDYVTQDDNSILRLCTLNNVAKPMADGATDVVLTMETLDIDPKKTFSKQLGVRVCFNLHAIQRLFQRIDFPVPDNAKQLDYSKIMEALRDANVWSQTVLNAMRMGKVLSQSDVNVNLIVPTRHGAFVGLFSSDMSTIHVRSFLSPDKLGERREIWERCRTIAQDTGMDLHWVSNTNFKDPKVVAAFVLAEDAGVFSINWNRSNTAKEGALDLQEATDQLRTRAYSGTTIRSNQSRDEYF